MHEYEISKTLVEKSKEACTIIVPLIFYARGLYATKDSAEDNQRWMGENEVSFVLLVSAFPLDKVGFLLLAFLSQNQPVAVQAEGKGVRLYTRAK